MHGGLVEAFRSATRTNGVPSSNRRKHQRSRPRSHRSATLWPTPQDRGRIRGNSYPARPRPPPHRGPRPQPPEDPAQTHRKFKPPNQHFPTLAQLADNKVYGFLAQLALSQPYLAVSQDWGDETWCAEQKAQEKQVVFVLDEDDTVFVIHARPLTEREKRRLRRQKK